MTSPIWAMPGLEDARSRAPLYNRFLLPTREKGLKDASCGRLRRLISGGNGVCLVDLASLEKAFGRSIGRYDARKRPLERPLFRSRHEIDRTLELVSC